MSLRTKAVVAVVILAVAVAAVLADMPASRPGEYHNKGKKFSMVPPSGWETKEGVMGLAVIFLSPIRSQTQTFRENINVVVENVPATMTMDAYLARSEKQLARAATDYKKLSSSRTTINGVQAAVLVFEHRIGKLTLKCVDYIYLKNNRGYIVTCSALTDTYADFEQTFQAACESFRLN